MQPSANLVILRSTGTLAPVPSRPSEFQPAEKELLYFNKKELGTSSSSNNCDCLKETFYPSDIVLVDNLIPEFKSRLIEHFLAYTKESMTGWRTVSSKPGITVQKLKVIMKDVNVSEVTKCTFSSYSYSFTII